MSRNRTTQYRHWLPSVIVFAFGRAWYFNLTTTQLRALLPTLHPQHGGPHG